MIDKRCIREVCIDDFALKKRFSYGTIMVDILSHRTVDKIDSREYDEVKQWLMTYPNLQIVSRDGSITVAAEPPLSPATQADENRTLTLKEKYDRIRKLEVVGYTKIRTSMFKDITLISISLDKYPCYSHTFYTTASYILRC